MRVAAAAAAAVGWVYLGDDERLDAAVEVQGSRVGGMTLQRILSKPRDIPRRRRMPGLVSREAVNGVRRSAGKRNWVAGMAVTSETGLLIMRKGIQSTSGKKGTGWVRDEDHLT